MKAYEQLLLQNKAWVQEKLSDDPLYFKRMAKGQQPRFLWIGCSDSRVPADEVTGTEPGELFVHRNIANLVVHADINLLSVLQYAVEVLEVKHIIVCGHYGCGGVNAAMTNKRLGIIDEWLQNIKDVYNTNKFELDAISTEQDRSNRLVELNVIAQVKHLAETSIVQNAWEQHQRPQLHGWVYGLDNGLIKPIIEMQPK
ncbi:MAG TPA: carbonate dehydratase [Chitinophagales bacterium]